MNASRSRDDALHGARSRVPQVPDEAMHAFGGGQRLRRTHPVRRHVDLFFIERLGLVVARVAADERAGGSEDLERHPCRGVGIEVVIEHGAVRRILASGFFRWQGRVSVVIAANSVSQLRSEKICIRCGYLCVHLP